MVILFLGGEGKLFRGLLTGGYQAWLTASLLHLIGSPFCQRVTFKLFVWSIGDCIIPFLFICHHLCTPITPNTIFGCGEGTVVSNVCCQCTYCCSEPIIEKQRLDIPHHNMPGHSVTCKNVNCFITACALCITTNTTIWSFHSIC